MSEANQPTSSPFSDFNCVNSTQAKPANCFDADLLDEQLITSEHSSGIFSEAAAYPVDNFQSAQWSASHCIEATENGLASLTPAEIATLVALIQEMRSSNTNLLERVIHLEQTLNECQKDLQLQKQRSRAAQSMLDRQTQDFTAAQEQVKSLSQELETAHEKIQNQQILVETLTTQVATSEERIAQMERECFQSQTSCNEQLHQRLQAENSCRELRSRLVRQQRYTMQLKVALEKSLELPFSGYQFQADSDSMLTNTTNDQVIYSQSLCPKAEPITPWSTQSPYFTNELEPTWSESSAVSGYWSGVNSNEQRTTKPFTLDVAEQSAQFDPNSQNTISESSCFSEDIEDEEENWQDLFTLLDIEAEKETANSGEDLLVASVASTPNDNDLAQLDKSKKAVGYASNSGTKSELSNQNQFQSSESPQPKTSFTQVNPNWPSPLVYPSHPPKGRKSLSAIELPTFTRRK